MNRYLTIVALTILIAGPVRAQQDENDVQAQIESLKATVAAQQASIERLRSESDENWLNERRAEEIKSLVREVLNDADTRASLLENGLTAGYNKHFFIASSDGTFLLQTTFKLQTRYIFNNADQPDGTDENEGGFQQRRTEIVFAGHVFDPKLTFKVKFEASRSSGDVGADDIYVNYKIKDDLQVRVGQFKAPFLREYLLSSGRQQAVERSFVNQVFNMGRTQGIQLSTGNDNLKLAVMLHDGANAKNLDFNADRTEIALAGRLEWLIAGTWKQFKDFAAWSNEGPALLLGGAVDYELGERGGAMSAQPDVFEWTVDASAEFKGINIFAAVVGQHVIDTNGNPASMEVDQYGFILQGGVFVVPDKVDVFARYEHLKFDDVMYGSKGSSSFTSVMDNYVNIITVGTNYYIKKHNIKTSVDLVWVLDEIAVSNTGAGLLTSDGEQFLLRAQLQLYY